MEARKVLKGKSPWSVEQDDCISWLADVAELGGVDLVLGSPPYPEKGKRYIGGENRVWKTPEWIYWMLDVTVAALRAAPTVVWVVNDAVRQGRYLPACEGLVWKWFTTLGHLAYCERPVIWHKNAPPNRRDWYSNDWEYVLFFCRMGTRPYFDLAPIGTPPLYKTGGHFRQRDSKGRRRKGGDYPQREFTQPRDVRRYLVGGGHMGSKLAHEGEAPYPESLCGDLLKAHLRPGGVVADCFAGTGTTLKVAVSQGKRAVGCDSRQSQVDLTRERMKEVS